MVWGARRDWHFTSANRTFQWVFGAWIAVPALVAPFWSLPALLKAIIAMVGNLLLAPVAVAVIFYFVNQRRMGEYRAGTGRNIVLGVTLVFALVLAITGIVRFFQ
jgi:Mn2+/Fe2+ NRAMP family transporter